MQTDEQHQVDEALGWIVLPQPAGAHKPGNMLCATTQPNLLCGQWSVYGA